MTLNKRHIPTLLLLLLTACGSHDETTDNGAGQSFPVEIDTSTRTGSEGDAVPYYGESLALTYIYPNTPHSIENGVSSDTFTRFGIKWESNDDIGIFYWEQTGERSKPMLWKGVGSSYPVNIYAYAPFIEPDEGTTLNYTNLSFSILQDQSDTIGILRSDLLGWQASAYTPTSSQQKLRIDFNHLFAELNVYLITGPDKIVSEDDLLNATVHVQNIRNTATFSIESMAPVIVQEGELTDVLPYCQPAVETEAEEEGEEGTTTPQHYRCVLPPQTIHADNNFVTVTVGERVFTYQPVADIDLQSNTSYTLTLEVGDTRLNPISIIPTPWGDPVIMTDEELELK